MQKLLALSLIFLYSVSFSSDNQYEFENSIFKNKRSYKKFLKRWNISDKKVKMKQLGLYPFRLIFNLAKFPITSSETTQRIARLPESGYYLIQGATKKDKQVLKKSGYRLMNGPTNLLAFVDGAISDSAGITTLLKNSLFKHTNRIKLCSTNIMELIKKNNPVSGHLLLPINPIKHIGYVIDGQWETKDPYGSGLVESMQFSTGNLCAPTPLIWNESPSLAIERLSCLDKNFQSTYSFTYFNCGGYTRLVGKSSGVGFEKFNNLGIGNYPYVPFDNIISPASIKKENKDELKVARNHCQSELKNKISSLLKLAHGQNISRDQFTQLMRESSMDIKLQTIILLAMSSKEYSWRQYLFDHKNNFYFDLRDIHEYYLKRRKMGKVVKNKVLRNFIKDLAQDLDERAISWLTHLGPDFKYFFN